mgnify:FL=1|jgi:hypothetical protein|tara:strand:+ start:425 stop:691 length:267 start_codon:yes stop_codon:yes gene_type:complete
MTKEIIVGVTISCSFGAIAWIVATLISVDKRTEVMAVQVSANHEMLTPLWEDFIQRKNSYGDFKITDEETNIKTSFKEEKEEGKKESW